LFVDGGCARAGEIDRRITKANMNSAGTLVMSSSPDNQDQTNQAADRFARDNSTVRKQAAL
jgi:hypothetical protein